MKDKKKDIIVSVIIPVYNEEQYLDSFIKTLIDQDYPKSNMEWIFVDGKSTDTTKEIINKYRLRYPNLILYYINENRTVPWAMNLGIKKSVGRYIVRLDAHSEYSKNYISRCVYYLERDYAENVGGVLETKSTGIVGNAIAKMLSTRFGVGNSQFRIGSVNGYVDTVPFGAFKREVFEKYGYYDERLTRNQDNEMNYRIRKNGGRIYLANDINAIYYSRSSIKSIIKMAYLNGKWNVITFILHPGAMGIRHFIPLLFLLTLIIIPFLYGVSRLFRILFLIEIMLYISLDILSSLINSSGVVEFFLLFFLYFIFHISYGLGSLIGILSVCMNKLSSIFSIKR